MVNNIPMPYKFYATFDVSNITSYIPDVPILLPASSWYRKGLKKPSIPSYITVKAADSGGFIASKIWGEYRYTLNQYVDWLGTWYPLWSATMDYCCEQELSVVTKERQDKTTINAWKAWNEYKNVSWTWTPTIQGLTPDDYIRHALEMKPLILEMQAYYQNNPYWRVGIGTLCKRANSEMIHTIVNEVSAILPDVPLHLWGIKFPSSIPHNVVSSDSAVWHGMFGSQRKAMHEIARLHGMNRQEYTIKVMLPAYINRVEGAVQNSIAIENLDTAWLKPAIHSYGYTLRLRKKRSKQYVYAVKRNGHKLEEIYIGAIDKVTPTLIQAKLGNVPAGSIPNRRSTHNDK